MVRAQIELANGQVRDLEVIMSSPVAEERKDMINKCLRLLEFAVQARDTEHSASSEQERHARYQRVVVYGISSAEGASEAGADGGVEIPIQRTQRT